MWKEEAREKDVLLAKPLWWSKKFWQNIWSVRKGKQGSVEPMRRTAALDWVYNCMVEGGNAALRCCG